MENKDNQKRYSQVAQKHSPKEMKRKLLEPVPWHEPAQNAHDSLGDKGQQTLYSQDAQEHNQKGQNASGLFHYPSPPVP